MVKTIAIVSLSAGMLGETFAAHELPIGERRLAQYGVRVKYMPHARRGIDYLRAHPEARAADLLQAFRDPEVDMILCAVGGDDTYRLLPYLFDHNELKQAVCEKIFLGFSDTTMNHFMLHKVGLRSFYGQAFLPDVCELGQEMLPYTRQYFEELLRTGTIREIRPSTVWYDARTNFGASEIGTVMLQHENSGFLHLQGASVFSGEILGGCIDTIYDVFNTERYADSAAVCRKYGILPPPADWKGKILLLETSEEQPLPARYRDMLTALKDYGIFDVAAGVLIGKPMNERYAAEYHAILREVVNDPTLPIVANLNVGHAAPRCIVPLGVPAVVDAKAQTIRFQV